MANYRVFNPDCAAAHEKGMGPTAHINQLDLKTQNYIKTKLGLELRGKAMFNPLTMREEIERAMNGRICDIEELVSSEDILDTWAVNNSFDPDAVDQAAAGWIAFDNAGGQCAFIVDLVDDPDSPCGKSWNIHEFSWNPDRGWRENVQATYWGFNNADELHDAITLPAGSKNVSWNMVPAPVSFLARELDVWEERAGSRRASSSEINRFTKEMFRGENGEVAEDIERYVNEVMRLNQEVDALNSEIEELQAKLASYRGSEIESENLLIERDKEIGSLKERLSAYEDVSTGKLSDLVEKPEYVSELSIFDVDHTSKFNTNGERWYEAYDYKDDRLSIHIEDTPDGWAWDLEANGTHQLGLSGDPVGALTEAKRAYAKLVAPPPARQSKAAPAPKAKAASSPAADARDAQAAAQARASKVANPSKSAPKK